MPRERSTLGTRVRQLREKLGWSQGALAEMIPGVKQQSIDQVEQGRVERPRFLPELAKVFGVTEEWLRTGKGRAAPAKAKEPGMDMTLLRDVVIAVEKTLDQHGLRLDHNYKAKLIGALYELMLGEERRTPDRLLAAANDIVGYEQLIKRKGR